MNIVFFRRFVWSAIAFALLIALCVVWVDRHVLTLNAPFLFENRDNVDIMYPLFDYYIDGLNHGQINFYQPFSWGGKRLWGDPNFQINIIEVFIGLVFGAKAIFTSLNFMYLAERIIAALGMFALISVICPTIPKYLRAALSLLYVFSTGYLFAAAFLSTSVHFATIPWLMFILATNNRITAKFSLAALTILLFTQFTYGQLQFTVYMAWLLLTFIFFYIPRTERRRALLLLGAASSIALLLSAYYILPLIDNLFFNDGGAGGRVAQGLDINGERVPLFYLARLFTPQLFSMDGVPWWPMWHDGWSPWESFSAFQGTALILLALFGLFLKRVPLYFKIAFLFLALSVTFKLGLIVTYVLNLGTSVPYGRQTVLLALIAPIIAAFTLREIVENKKTALAFAIWCGVWSLGFLGIYIHSQGILHSFIEYAFSAMKDGYAYNYHPGDADAFFNQYAPLMQSVFAMPALVAGLSALAILGISRLKTDFNFNRQFRGFKISVNNRSIAYVAVTVMCMASLGQTMDFYQQNQMRFSNVDDNSKYSIDVRHPVEDELALSGAEVKNGPVAYRIHTDIYFGEHRRGTDPVYRLMDAHPEDNRFRTLPNSLAAQHIPVTTGYSSLIPQDQMFSKLMMWDQNQAPMGRAIGERTKLHPGLLESFAVKWVLRHQPSLVTALQGRPDWVDAPFEKQFMKSSRLVYADDVYRLYEYLDARPAIDIPNRIAFGQNAVSTLGALEEVDKPWLPTAALPMNAISMLLPTLKSKITTEHGESVVLQSGTILKTEGVAGHWANLTIKANDPAIVLLGIKYDRWWKVYVNGELAPLIRANDIFAAVQVPSGISEVRVVLRPWSAWIGILISITSIFGIFVYFAISQYKRRRGSRVKA